MRPGKKQIQPQPGDFVARTSATFVSVTVGFMLWFRYQPLRVSGLPQAAPSVAIRRTSPPCYKVENAFVTATGKQRLTPWKPRL